MIGIRVMDQAASYQLARPLLDSGSDVSFLK